MVRVKNLWVDNVINIFPLIGFTDGIFTFIVFINALVLIR